MSSCLGDRDCLVKLWVLLVLRARVSPRFLCAAAIVASWRGTDGQLAPSTYLAGVLHQALRALALRRAFRFGAGVPPSPRPLLAFSLRPATCFRSGVRGAACDDAALLHTKGLLLGCGA